MFTRTGKLSFQVRLYIVLALILIHLLFSLDPSTEIRNGKLRNVETYQDLENLSVFSFSIISDNHGQSPYSNLGMAKANYHIRKSNDLCVLGVGDHLMNHSNNEFLFYICNDNYWRTNFYPSISDGENIFYGKSQADWGAGKIFFDVIGMRERRNVEFSAEGVDYYSIIEAPRDYKIHWISLYFPDEPPNPKLGFRESSKRFLAQTLSKIKKTEKDIIVIGAHSQYGYWLNELHPDLYRLVCQKADIVVGASTHYYERYTPDGLLSQGPLILNTGSAVSPRFGSAPGFVQIRVLEQHRGMYINYVDVSKPNNTIASTPFAYFRTFTGKIYEMYYGNYQM